MNRQIQLCWVPSVFMMTTSNGSIFRVNGFFVQGIHQSLANSPQKGQWCRALLFSVIRTWINGWVNNREAGDLRRHCAHYHTMHLLWEKFQWILPLYMKPISFQSRASVVCSVTAAIFIDLCLKKLNVYSQHIGQKTNEYLNIWKNPQELKCWSTFCVNYFLRYYSMMQHQPTVKRVNGTHEWAHRPYQLLSTPYHCCLYKHRRQDERQPPQSSWPVPICT